MRINSIKLNDSINGEGLMLSVWVQGCPHRCKGCHNPETWSFKGDIVSDEEILNYIIKNIDLNNIQRNLSILGGEPLCKENLQGVIFIAKNFKKIYPDRKIFLWTGYTFESLTEEQKEILKYLDILIDGKFEEEKRDLKLKLRGSSNQRVLNVKDIIKK